MSTAEPVGEQRAREAFATAPGIVLVDEHRPGGYPMPLEVSGTDPVYTGYNHADDVRNLQPVEEHGRKQDYGQHNQEDLYRLRHQCLPRGYHRPLCSRM